MASDAVRRADNDDDDRAALVRGYYDGVAREYDSSMEAFDRVMLGRGRRRVCSGARGRTLEMGVGTGANLAHYPPDASVTAIDVSPEMLAIARQHAQELDLDIELRLGDAHDLVFADDEFDTVTATLLLSTVPDPQRVVSEMRRVLRPGGRVLLLDFVRCPVVPLRWVERALKPLTARSGFSLPREPLDYLGVAGLTVDHVDQFRPALIVNGFRCVIEEVGASKASSDRERDRADIGK
ncbi:MAG TPA: methyltransferase domain-containing protein [Acidimicrobiia bacterium]